MSFPDQAEFHTRARLPCHLGDCGFPHPYLKFKRKKEVRKLVVFDLFMVVRAAVKILTVWGRNFVGVGAEPELIDFELIEDV